MKKYVLTFFSLVVAIGLSALITPKFASVNFHFIPANGSEIAYENAASWEVVGSTHPECASGPFNDVCILRIDDSKLTPYSGISEQKLAKYLAAQDGTEDYANATGAVVALTISMKP